MIEHADEAGPFWKGDIPAAPVRLYFDNDLTGYTTIRAFIDGEEFANTPVTDPEDRQADLAWGATGLAALDDPGKHELSLVAERTIEDGTVTARARIGTFVVIVMFDDGWHTLDSARIAWGDAPTVDAVLSDLLDSARDQVIEFAPVLAADAPIPTNYRQGQLMQARALWQSTLANSSDQINGDGFTVTVYPMDRTIKNLLRPKRGVPWILAVPNGRS